MNGSSPENAEVCLPPYTKATHGIINTASCNLLSQKRQLAVPKPVRPEHSRRVYGCWNRHPKGERGKAAHASTSLSTNGFSPFQLPLLGLLFASIDQPNAVYCRLPLTRRGYPGVAAVARCTEVTGDGRSGIGMFIPSSHDRRASMPRYPILTRCPRTYPWCDSSSWNRKETLNLVL